jgi:hypothetical protein
MVVEHPDRSHDEIPSPELRHPADGGVYRTHDPQQSFTFPWLFTSLVVGQQFAPLIELIHSELIHLSTAY